MLYAAERIVSIASILEAECLIVPNLERPSTEARRILKSQTRSKEEYEVGGNEVTLHEKQCINSQHRQNHANLI
jgi:hypothetical protein